MLDHIRRLVSGNKARHKDSELDLELDLAYITDNVIVMGYPASGVEGLYRNRREDAKKFLEHHHGDNFWVFNFCPVKENAYPASVFDGRVNRYPFPDHHAPPLAILPLAAREMRLWLDGSPERVAALHCKAGKGRSGTMACAYLLTRNIAPSAPSLERNLSEKEMAKSRAEQVMNAMPLDEAAAEVIATTTQPLGGEDEDESESEDLVKLELADGISLSNSDTHTDRPSPPATESEPGTHPSKKHPLDSLSHVLELHTARRMRRPTSTSAKLKQGVSIPSQRRWLYYWSLVLARQAPPDFWSLSESQPGDFDPASAGARRARPTPKVRLTKIRLRMRELGGFTTNLVRAANALLEGVGKRIDARAGNSNQVWASLARYDDEFVDTLEEWERYTRDEGGAMGVRRKGADADEMSGEAIEDLFKDDRWDGQKMVRSFARMGTLKDEDVRKEVSEEDGKIETLVLRPLTGEKWQSIRAKIEAADGQAQQSQTVDTQAVPGTAPTSIPTLSAGLETEDASLYDVTQTLGTDGGVVLDAHREVRVKLYLGQVFMGWFWFIPTFHMQHRGHGEGPGAQRHATTFTLKRKELDFPIGLGANVIDVAVSMEWCTEATNASARDVGQLDATGGKVGDDPQGVAATLTAVMADGMGEMVHAKQAAED